MTAVFVEGFGLLGRADAEHVTITRWAFAAPDAATTALRRFRRAEPGTLGDVDALTFLAGTAGPVDAGILRGTARAADSPGTGNGLVVVHSEAEPPVPALWAPPDGRLIPGPTRFRHHRDVRSPHDSVAGLAVLVEIEFDRPDPQRARTWVDLLVRALETDPRSPEGLICARFHVSDDGSLVANLALWTSEAAYDRALAAGPPGVARTDTPEWRAATQFEGIRRNTIHRFGDGASWRSTRARNR
jgi:hypothetical protein